MDLDLSRPGEKKKLIWAAALGLVALVFLWWTFIGFGSGKQTPTRTAATATAAPDSTNRLQSRRPVEVASTPKEINVNDLQVIPVSITLPQVPEPKRNIFAFYEKPVAPTGSVTPTPTPTPTPPILLASISPANVFAKTADFTLEIAGDKFTPEMRIFVDSSELPTKFKGPQQMSATVSAAIIANPGARSVAVHTPDNREYSNTITLNVAPPPTPNYTYVGIIGDKHYVNTAILQDKNNKDILSTRLGDLVGGRFRVNSISDKEVVLVDTVLKIRHQLPMTEGDRVAGAPLSRPTPRVDAEDDEP